MVAVSYADKEVTVNGLKLHYQEWGHLAAPPMLLLHGFGVSGHMFDEFAERMQDRYRLIALDQRGHGDSDWAPEGDYSRDAFIRDIEGFREALGLDDFILVAHSMGGLNAVGYTVAHQVRVRSLVLIDVGPEAAKEGVDNIVRFTRGPDELDFEEFVEMAHRFNQRRTMENIRERMRHRLKQMPNGKWTWKFDSKFRTQDSTLRVGSDQTNDQTWAQFRDIRCPVLLVRGAESDVLTQEVADRCIREMQRARLVVVPGAGHSVPGDNPDAFTEVVTEFLGDVDRGRFEPYVEAAPPPLADLLTAQEYGNTRRGPGLGTLILVGAGAAIALAGVTLVASKKSSGKKKSRAARLREEEAAKSAEASNPGTLDAKTAQALIESLAAMAQRNTDHAAAVAGAVAASADAARKRRRAGVLRTAVRLGWKTATFAPALMLASRKPKKQSRGLLPWAR
jgi:esterase